MISTGLFMTIAERVDRNGKGKNEVYDHDALCPVAQKCPDIRNNISDVGVQKPCKNIARHKETVKEEHPFVWSPLK